MTEIKFYKVERITEDILTEAIEIAQKKHCIIRLLWRPNRYNPEQHVEITETTSKTDIDTFLIWAKGPWGM